MRTDAAARRSSFSLLLIVSMALLVVVGPVDARPQLPQAEQVIEEDGLRLVRHVDGTYEVSAEAVVLEGLVAHLVGLSGAEFTISPELLLLPVTLETDRVGLTHMLEQLRAALEANLILAATQEHQVSRVWLTATNATPLAAATPAAETPAGAVAMATPGLQTMPVPPGGMPAPTGNEVRVAGLEPGVDIAEYIRNQAAAASTSGAGAATGTAGAPPATAGGAPGTPGGPPGAPGAEPGAEGQPAEQSAPPVPMDPNALETYFAGDKTTSTYHRLNCIQAMYLPAANKIWFKSRQEAIAAGFTPHEICVAR